MSREANRRQAKWVIGNVNEHAKRSRLKVRFQNLLPVVRREGTFIHGRKFSGISDIEIWQDCSALLMCIFLDAARFFWNYDAAKNALRQVLWKVPCRGGPKLLTILLVPRNVLAQRATGHLPGVPPTQKTAVCRQVPSMTLLQCLKCYFIQPDIKKCSPHALLFAFHVLNYI